MTKDAKLTTPQRHALVIMAQGCEMHYWHAFQDRSAFLRDNTRTTVNCNTFDSILKRGYLIEVEKDWRRSIYVISVTGRAALDKELK